MKFVQEGYQRGPIHVGKMIMTLRGYIWTHEDVEKYLKMKDEEDFELMKAISSAVKVAMESLGGELLKYLEQAERMSHEGKEEKPAPEFKKESMLRRAFGDFVGHEQGHGGNAKKDHGAGHKPDKHALDKEADDVKADLKNRLFISFKNFKKGHGMVMW